MRLLFVSITFVMWMPIFAKEPSQFLYNKGNVTITTTFDGSDSLQLLMYPYFFNLSYADGNSNIPSRVYEGHKDLDNKVKYTIRSIDHPCYFSIVTKTGQNQFRGIRLPELFLFEPGDMVNITIGNFNAKKNRTLLFSGRGSEKYICQWMLDSIFLRNKETRMQLLQSFEKSISSIAYSILKADIISKDEIVNIRLLNSKVDRDIISKDGALEGLENLKDTFSNAVMAISKFYPYYIISRMASVFKYSGHSRAFNYSYFKTRYAGVLKDKIITAFISNYRETLDDSLMIDAISNVKVTYFKNILRSFIDPILKGNYVDDFRLENQYGDVIKLSDFKGKVVFIDFWFTGCTACSGYYNSVVSKIEKLFKNNKNVVFVSVSVDRDKTRWLASLSNDEYTSKDVINLYTNGDGDDNPVIKKYKVESFPSPMLIDKKMKIFSINKLDLRTGGPDKLSETINKALIGSSGN